METKTFTTLPTAPGLPPPLKRSKSVESPKTQLPIPSPPNPASKLKNSKSLKSYNPFPKSPANPAQKCQRIKKFKRPQKISPTVLEKRLNNFTHLERRKRYFDNIPKSDSIDTNFDDQVFFHPVTKKIKLNDNPKVKIVISESVRESTGVTVFKDKDIYTDNQAGTGFSKLLKLNGKDYDADTTESEEAKGVQNSFGSLMQAVNGIKKNRVTAKAG
jgi:hypothetical protein